MRKCLLLVVLLICAQWTDLAAQGLFELPSDTVCIRQPIQLRSNVDANSYYWGFCSGYLKNPVTVSNIGAGFNLDNPNSIEVMKDGDNYYGFVVNRGTGELTRFSYGNSLSNTPTVRNLGNLENNIPAEPNNLYLMKDGANYHMFVTGGSTAATSSLSRIDFGTSLANTPNSVSFGNVNNILNKPTGVFVAKDGSNYYGYVINAGNNHLIRLSFTANISLTPVATDLGTFAGAFNNASDMVGVQDNGFWYLFVTNEGSSTLSRIDCGNTLANNPSILDYGNLGGTLTNPSGLTIIRDCDLIHAYIVNRTGNDLIEVQIPAFSSTYTATNLGPFPVGTFNGPADISRVLRERDNLYSYVVNSTDGSVTRITFPQCTDASIQSSLRSPSDSFYYNTPGFYNIYLAINEGMPDARVECRQIRVLDIPPMTISDDTTICQADTANLIVQSPDAISYTWRPNYNLSDTAGIFIKAYPEYTTTYRINIPYPNGCVVDTAIVVNVWKNRADAGPDRLISDGSYTMLGGPLTTTGSQYTYTWFPDQYMESPYSPVTKVAPASDLTYYLMVRDNNGCVDVDTVIVKVSCDDLNLPNAFQPGSSNGANNTFGLLNHQIIQLNYFRIFDRWGKEVFKTTDVTKRWDGNVNGEPAPLGVYVWEADGFCITQKRFTRSGNVTLIR